MANSEIKNGILLFCSKAVGQIAFETLIAADAPIAGLVSVNGSETAALLAAADQQNIPCFLDIHLNPEANYERLLALEAAVTLSISYPKLIPAYVLNAFNGRAYNFHPARLPEYRGCFPTVWPILNGDKTADYTMHVMEEEFDTGPVVDRETLDIGAFETGWSLYGRLVDILPMLIRRNLDALLSGEVVATQQSKENAGYYPNRLPANGRLNWEWSGTKIVRFVRALFHPEFPCAIAVVKGREIEVMDADFRESKMRNAPPGTVCIESDGVYVSCPDGQILLKAVRVAGRNIYLNQSENLSWIVH